MTVVVDGDRIRSIEAGFVEPAAGDVVIDLSNATAMPGLFDMHVKDIKVATELHSDTEVGRGVINFPALFRTLLDIGYQGQVGLEYEINAKAPLQGMIESMAYMRGVLAAVATPTSH